LKRFAPPQKAADFISKTSHFVLKAVNAENHAQYRAKNPR